MIEHFPQVPTRRVWACVALTVVAVVTVALWAWTMDGDSSQTAAMLGATIAATTAAASATGRRSCRPAILSRGRRHPGQ
jgi:NhaP-type Na+/H+ or K+/H+ antiporter